MNAAYSYGVSTPSLDLVFRLYSYTVFVFLIFDCSSLLEHLRVSKDFKNAITFFVYLNLRFFVIAFLRSDNNHQFHSRFYRVCSGNEVLINTSFKENNKIINIYLYKDLA